MELLTYIIMSITMLVTALFCACAIIDLKNKASLEHLLAVTAGYLSAIVFCYFFYKIITY